MATTGLRPGSASRLKTGATQQGTATRLTTAQRPTTKGGAVLGQALNVNDRPITQQGLGGIKTAARGPRRQVEDKSYFIGLLRAKCNELNVEIAKLQREMQLAHEDRASFVQYEKMAEKLAAEIKEEQGLLGDYNTLVDKLNTDEDINNVQMDFEELRATNEREERARDTLFEEHKHMEAAVHAVEIELEQEKRMADNLVADMNPAMRKKYHELKTANEHFLKQLDLGQQQLDELNSRSSELEEELSQSQVKQEAMRLYEQLHDVETKRDHLLEEQAARKDPQQEREALLDQVKQNNQEIGSIERQTNELRDKIVALQAEINQIEEDIEGTQGDHNQKYRELRKREEQMDEFMSTFEENRVRELNRIQELEASNVALLEHMSSSMARVQHLPSPAELEKMKDQLKFKSDEMKKSEVTSMGLAGEHAKLQQDLQKVDQLEAKITTEMLTLQEKIEKMETELELYNNVDKLKSDGETKRAELMEEKIILSKRREQMKQLTRSVSNQCDAQKSLLAENETHAQLSNLERKWQTFEQNNFVMKEFIANKSVETDYQIIAKRVSNTVASLNTALQESLAKRAAI